MCRMAEDKRNLEGKKITIYDIAREAGVSPATVSRVLTGNAGVRSDKYEAVQALISKYNFRPNALARGLSETRRRRASRCGGTWRSRRVGRSASLPSERGSRRGRRQRPQSVDSVSPGSYDARNR